MAFKIPAITIIATLLLSCWSGEYNLPRIERKFRETTFEPAPFQNKAALRDLTQFLLAHADTLIAFRQHEEEKTIQLAGGSFYGHYQKTGDCFIFASFLEEFVRDYVPPHLVDSLYTGW